jgi:hypothetical protein
MPNGSFVPLLNQFSGNLEPASELLNSARLASEPRQKPMCKREYPILGIRKVGKRGRYPDLRTHYGLTKGDSCWLFLLQLPYYSIALRA